jgi:integrase
MSKNDLLNDAFVQRWLNGLSERTKQNYLERIPSWIEFIGMSPTEQIQKRLKDTASSDLTERTYFECKFREFKEVLEKKGTFKARTVTTVLTAVASFFGRNDVPLNLKRGDWKSTLSTEVIQRFKLTQDDVKRMYGHANLRDKVLLLGLAQSGFSEIDLSVLKVEDIKGLYDLAVNEHYVIEKPREKTNEIQATCLSYEFLHDLRDLLAERNNPASGYIFTSQTRKTQGEPIEVRQINTAMKNLAERTFGKEKAKEFQTKALRSFYNSALLRANIQPQELKDLLMGHGRIGARANYGYDEETIRVAYLSAFAYLSINGIQSREDLSAIKRDMKKQTDYLVQIITEIKAQNDKFKTKLESLGVDVSTIKKTQASQGQDILEIQDKVKIKPKPLKDTGT